MRVAIFGGSFNPPHVAHQLVALYVLETMPVDELWFVPTFLHPFEKPLEPFADRFEMCRRAAAALGPRVRVSDVEARLGGSSRTLRTVRALVAERPGDTFSLVIGSDLVAETRTWFDSDELQALVPFIVVARAGRDPAANAVAMPEISSTEIRAALAAGGSVAPWVCLGVLDYIRQAGLYGSPRVSSP